jgi:hypothetical protein
MALVIPPEIKREVNNYSGYITPDSPYSQKTLKGLFRSPVNIRYLANELYLMICEPNYVKNTIVDFSQYFSRIDFMISEFKKSKPTIDATIYQLVEVFQLPFKEDQGVLNPIQQLHSVNLNFLVESSTNIIQNPQNLVPIIADVNPETGAFEGGVEYDYNASSYNDGTWHPEHLFTNSYRNRQEPYWKVREVNIYSDPNTSGSIPGHKYNDIIYNHGTEDYYESDKDYNGNPKGEKEKSTRSHSSYGQFPAWQITPQKRFYDRNDLGGYRDQAKNDRRVQSPRAYGLRNLLSGYKN